MSNETPRTMNCLRGRGGPCLGASGKVSSGHASESASERDAGQTRELVARAQKPTYSYGI